MDTSGAQSPGDAPRVVVVGAGFGGLWAARALDGQGVNVRLIDRNNYHTFFPLLYQVAASEIGPQEIAYPVRSILRKARDIEFRVASLDSVELDSREVVVGGERLSYDYLILALGSEPNFFGVEGAAEHAFPLRWMAQALPLRHHILSCFERAVSSADPERRNRALTFTVVGGGATGVEFSGALAELIYGPLLADFPRLSRDEVSVVLLERGSRLLPTMPESLGAYALRRLRRREVVTRLGAAVSRVTAGAVSLADGDDIPTETVVWTAGVMGSPRVAEWGLPVGFGGRVVVEPTLQVPGHPEVFVVGDLAYFEHRGEPGPQVAPVAIQQGRAAAANVLKMVSGRNAEPFRFKDPGMIAVIGRNAAVAVLFGRNFKGVIAWLLWLSIHIAKLIGFRNRLLVLVNWAWNYTFFRRSARLILPSRSRR